MKTTHHCLLMALILTLPMFYATANAAPRIAILDFELNDITSLPNTQQERIRTASIRPVLEQALSSTDDYEIIRIDLDRQKQANAGFGYLFKYPDVAAKLGKTFGADWIVVGQHSKPSFLFSYLIAKLVNVTTGKLAARFAIELKGTHHKVTERGVTTLAKEIIKAIKRR